LVVVVVVALAFALGLGLGLGPAVWTGGCVDLFLIFVSIGSYPIAQLGLMQPFVSLAVHHHHRNLNIANIQTSPNKKVDNILFLFILLRCVVLRCVALHWCFGKNINNGLYYIAILSFVPKQSHNHNIPLKCFI
jgi:hypothetical protein